MSNYAALVSPLSISGSRLTDGTANASGVVYFFQPGTNTTVNVYSNATATTVVTQPVTLGAGGKLPTQYSAGIFTTQPVRVLIQDAEGNTVTDNVFIPSTAGATGVSNAGFTDSTLDAVLTDAYTSFGGQDWKYKESGGATSRTVKAKFAEIWISVKDFGAVGDNNTVDTTAIQAAMDRVKALGGGVCYFPPGTYKTDQSLTLSSATGVRLVGAGSRAAIIATTHATAATLVLDTCTACTVENIRLEPAGANSSNGITASSCADTGIYRLTMKSNHAGGVLIAGTGNVYINESSLVGTSYDFYASGTSTPSTIISTTFAGTAGNVFLTGTATDIAITNCRFRGTTGIEFDSGLTGTNFVIAGCPTLGTRTNPLTVGTATLPVYRQWGNGIETSSNSSAVGGTHTPFLYKGGEILFTAASGGAGAITVNAPAVLPGTETTDVNLYWDLIFKNGSGGAVTWTMNAVYVLAAAVPTTDGHTIGIRVRWDRVSSKLREVSRADTVT